MLVQVVDCFHDTMGAVCACGVIPQDAKLIESGATDSFHFFSRGLEDPTNLVGRASRGGGACRQLLGSNGKMGFAGNAIHVNLAIVGLYGLSIDRFGDESCSQWCFRSLIVAANRLFCTTQAMTGNRWTSCCFRRWDSDVLSPRCVSSSPL